MNARPEPVPQPVVPLYEFQRLDLHDVLDGAAPPEPDLVLRTDGRGLLYAGRLHWLMGEPESGKTWFACAAVADCIALGRDVAFFDYEDSAAAIVGRLKALGVSIHLILEHLRYFSPPGRITPEVLGFYETEELIGVSLVVVDANTEAMVTEGLSPEVNGDVATWLRGLPATCSKVGAATLVLDHVTKSTEGRGRWAIGAQHKLAAADVAYAIRATDIIARGRTGRSVLRVSKDRPGGVRAFATDGKVAAALVVDAESEGEVRVRLEPIGRTEPWVPADRMREILAAARADPVVRSRDGMAALVMGRRTIGLTAVNELINRGDLIRAGGTDKRPLYLPTSEEEA